MVTTLFQSSSAKLPEGLTSYDFLKTLAVLLMIVDHVGYIVYPDEMWFRVIGRLCIPVWFFLIGYARSRDLSPRLWTWAGILFAVELLVGRGLLPVNILMTFILIRMIIDPLMERIGRDPRRRLESVMLAAVILGALALPSSLFSEYGTPGLMFAMTGYMSRRLRTPEKPGEYTHIERICFSAVSVAVFAGIQTMGFGFSIPQSTVLMTGTGAILLLLFSFRPVEWTYGECGVLRPVVPLLHLTGRRTLEIYAIHLAALFLMAAILGDPRFSWLGFSWFKN